MRGTICRLAGLLTAWAALAGGTAWGQGGPYAPPDPQLWNPLYSTQPADGGFFSSMEFVAYRQTNPLRNQTIAVRGFQDTSGQIGSSSAIVTQGANNPSTTTGNAGTGGTPGLFFGDAMEALNARNVSGPQTYAPGFKIALGWRFAGDNAGTLTFSWMYLTSATYRAAATLAPPLGQVGQNFENTFLFSPVYNFPNDFAGPPIKIQGPVSTIFVNVNLGGGFGTTVTAPVVIPGPPPVVIHGTTVITALPGPPLGTVRIQDSSGATIPISIIVTGNQYITVPLRVLNDIPFIAYGIWNGASIETLQFQQKVQQYEFNYREPIYETECYRLSGEVGPRFFWIWEGFQWTAISEDSATGTYGPTDGAIYENIDSNRMYGCHVGCDQEWYLGHGFAVELDTQVAAFIDIVKERASYTLLQRDIIEMKRARTDYTIAGEAQASVNIDWYPIEGVQVKAGYDVMGFIKTLSSPRPVSFNYGALDPSYRSTARFFDGFNLGLALIF